MGGGEDTGIAAERGFSDSGVRLPLPANPSLFQNPTKTTGTPGEEDVLRSLGLLHGFYYRLCYHEQPSPTTTESTYVPTLRPSVVGDRVHSQTKAGSYRVDTETPTLI